MAPKFILRLSKGSAHPELAEGRAERHHQRLRDDNPALIGIHSRVA